MKLQKKITLACTLAAGVAVQAIWGSTAAAQTNYYWDTSPTTGLQAGGGNWTAGGVVDTNFNDASNGTGTRTVWLPGTGNNIANFSGTGSTVTVNETISLGRLNVTGGSYVFSGSGALDFGTNAGVINNTFNLNSFALGLAGSNGISKSGSATMAFIGTGTYSGALTVSGGAFTLGNTTAVTNRLSSSSSLQIGSTSASGTVTMSAATAGTTSQTLANLSAGSGLNTLNSTNASASNLGNLTFNGTYARSNTGVLSITSVTGFNVTTNFTNVADGTNIIDGALVGVYRANTFVANSGSANASIATTANVWGSGTHTLASSNNVTPYTGTTASLRLSGLRTITLGSGAVINTGMITNNGGSVASPTLITGGTLTSGNGRDLILLGGDSAYRFEIASQIVDNGLTPIGLLIAGAGTNSATGGVIISGNNLYTGDTTLGNGTINAGSDTAFGAGGTVRFTGGTLLATANRSLANNIDLPFNGTIGAGTYNLSLGGNMTGAGNLTLNNTGVTTLSGSNTGHTGSVIINSATATLALGSANAIGTGVNFTAAGTVTSSNSTARSFAVNNYPAAGGTFGLPGTGDLSVTLPTFGANPIAVNVGNTLTTWTNSQATGTGATITKAGAGTLAFSGDFSLTGSAVSTGVTINSGVVQVGTGSTTGNLFISGAAANVNGAGGALAFNRSNALAWSTPITGSVGLQQLGGGTTTLTGTHTYSGQTTVNAGKLTVDSLGTINSTSGVSIGAGEFNYNSATSLTQPIVFSSTGGKLSGGGTINSPVVVSSGNFLAPGNSIGTLTVANTLSVSGIASFELDKTLGVRTNDKVIGITAPPTFAGGTLSVSLTGSGFSTADKWDLFDWTGATITSTFASVPTGTSGAPSGFKWNTSQLYSDGIIGLDLAYTAPVLALQTSAPSTTGGQITARNAGTTSAPQGTFSPATGSTLTITGQSGAYTPASVTNITGGTNAGYVAVTGFNPGSDANIYLLNLKVNGSDPTSLQSAQIASDLSGLLLGNLATSVLPTDLTTIAGTTYDVMITFPTGVSASQFFGLSFASYSRTGVGGDGTTPVSGVTFDAITVIPEPGTLVSALGFAAGLLAIRRRRA